MRTRILLGLAIALAVSACTPEPTEPESPEYLGPNNLALGNPSNAKADITQPENYLITRPQYALAYNKTRGTANWVSWYLNKDWIGASDRQDDFRPDESLPASWYKVISSDYTATGFDRGHSCPSGDRTITVADNSATFLMTNIIPQAPGHNQGPWAQLELYCRKLVNEGNELYIIMGNYGLGGVGTGGYREKLASGKMTVPRYIWKVIVVLPEGDNDLSRINKNTRVIAVNIINRDDVSNLHWGDFRVKVNDIEEETGLNLFTELSTATQNSLEAKLDDGPVN
ncbi:MAG: DNA/RNA non-specific endonuclease [Haliscomenobacter sp.]|nr:DNA/RNA non-specific endonuclease [Haliscomenobacter sp.]